MEQTVSLGILFIVSVSFFDKVRPEKLVNVASSVRHNIDNSRTWIKNINQQDLDISSLVETHGLVCPPTNRCSPDGPNVFSPAGLNKLTSPSNISFVQCRTCECDHICRSLKNCCPDSFYGFLDLNCVNVAVLPDGSEDFYNMIAHCPPNFTNQALAKQCQDDDLNPVSSKDTKLAYKNSACASCYKEDNLMEWGIAVKCLYGRMLDLKGLSSMSDLKRLLYTNDCIISYHLEEYGNKNMVPARCRPRGEENVVDRCNVTGLWMSYDMQIEMACNVLEYRFLNFKNVFCFICNPGPLSARKLSKIDACNMTSKWKDYDAELESLCLHMPAIGRLAPFKNVYCMLCNGINTADVSDRFQELRMNVSIEEVSTFSRQDHKILLDIRMDISLKGEHVVSDARHLLNSAYGKKLLMFKPKLLKRNKTKAPFTETLTFLKSLEQICGGAKICTDSLTLLGYTGNETFGYNDFCEYCHCDSSCAEEGTCCQDILFKKRPYSCFGRTNVLTIPPGNKLGSISKGLAEDDSFNNYFLVIDTCLNTQNSTLVNLCQGMDKMDELSFIPITGNLDHMAFSKADFKQTAYRNLHCLQCNVRKPSRVVISLRILCDNFVEMYLFTEFLELMSHFNTYCETSFVIKHSKLCLDRTMERNPSVRIDFVRRPMNIRNAELDSSLREMLARLYGNGTDDVQNYFTRCNQSGTWDGKEPMLREICEVDTDQSLLALPRYRINSLRYFNFACFACNPDVAASDIQLETPISHCNFTGSWNIWDNDTVDLCERNDEVSYWMPFKNMYCSKCNHEPVGVVGGTGLDYGDIPSFYRLLFGVSDNYWSYQKNMQDDVICAKGTLDPVTRVAAHTRLDSDNIPSLYRRLFDISDKDWSYLKNMQDDVICANGTLDPVTKSCRELYCKEGYVLPYSRVCKPFNLTAKMIVVNVSMYLNKHPDCYSSVYPLMFSSECPNNFTTEIYISFGDIFKAIRTRIEDGLDNTTTSIFDTFIGETTESNCVKGHGISVIHLKNVHIKIHMLVFSTENITQVFEACIKAQTGKYEIISNSEELIQLFATSTSQHTDQMQIDTLNTIPSGCEDTVWSSSHAQPTIQKMYEKSINVDKFFTCPQVQLSQKEIQKFNKTDVKLKDTEAVFFFGEYYESEDGFLRICLDTYEDRVMSSSNDTEIANSELAFPYYIFSVVCTALSLICLLVTFIVYCILREIRTVPGQNNMVLCFCLFCAQLILQFGFQLNANIYVCAVIGILIHFFWLSSFCAMNVCAYHVFNVFCCNNMQVHASVSRLRYCIYTFGAPFLIIGTSVLVHMFLSDMKSCGYGQSRCFLTDITSIIVTFLIPSVLIFASNIALFAKAVLTIRSRPSVQSSANRNDLFIYIKLSTLTGFSWPLQFVDALLELSMFSFFVVAVNALQGVFIFLSFICNARVATLLRAKLRCCPKAVATTGDRGLQSSSGKSNATEASVVSKYIHKNSKNDLTKL